MPQIRPSSKQSIKTDIPTSKYNTTFNNNKIDMLIKNNVFFNQDIYHNKPKSSNIYNRKKIVKDPILSKKQNILKFNNKLKVKNDSHSTKIEDSNIFSTTNNNYTNKQSSNEEEITKTNKILNDNKFIQMSPDNFNITFGFK